MKKQLILLIVSVFFLAFARAQSDFKIEGYIAGLDEPARIFLQYSNGSERITDSVVTKKGKFAFNGRVNRPQMATLTAYPLHGDGPTTMGWEQKMTLDGNGFYIDGGKIEIKGKNLETAEIKGGKTQKEYQSLQDQLSGLQREMKEYQDRMAPLRKEKNEEAQNEILKEIRKVRVKMNKIEDDFIPMHPDSYVSFDMVNQKAVIINPETFEPVYNTLSERLRNTEEGKAIGKRLDIAKRTSVGQTAMDFTQNNMDGKPVSLSSLRGKYILLDFWASWCGPCRAENPNVLKAYNQFKDKNFDVLAVSLDENREDWLKAVKDDGMPWIHVSDLLGFENAAAVQYGIRAIPQNFLIDPKGTIVATNLRGDDLEETLSKIIKN